MHFQDGGTTRSSVAIIDEFGVACHRELTARIQSLQKGHLSKGNAKGFGVVD